MKYQQCADCGTIQQAALALAAIFRNLNSAQTLGRDVMAQLTQAGGAASAAPAQTVAVPNEAASPAAEGHNE